jgi:hypothetical protein
MIKLFAVLWIIAYNFHIAQAALSIAHTTAQPMSNFVFVAGAYSAETSICSKRSLTYCTEAHVLLNETIVDGKGLTRTQFTVVGRAYQTIDAITWSGDSAPGYLNKQSYSKSIGTAGVLHILRRAFRHAETDIAAEDDSDVCTSTGVNNHYMQATIQVYGAKAPDRCLEVEVAWRTVTYDAINFQVDEGTTSTSAGSVNIASTPTSTTDAIAITSLVIFCLLCTVLIVAFCGKSGAACLLGCCRICYNK